MEGFMSALARVEDPVLPEPESPPVASSPPHKVSERVIALSPRKLKAKRVVSFDGADEITRSFDVLRNTCMKDLAPRVANRPMIGVTSPSAESGVSTTAINLAFSLARLKKGNVLLADLAPADQGCWRQLGLGRKDVEFCSEHDRIVPMQIAGLTVHGTSLLPVIEGRSGAEIETALRDWGTRMRRELGPVSIVLDVPPLLSDERAAHFMSELDLVVLVLATSKSRMADLDTCRSYLHGATKVQLVLNKARSYDF